MRLSNFITKNKNKLFLVLILFLILEIGIRAFGFLDFPLYYADNVIGYIPLPTQSGAFLKKNKWSFNSLSMQNDEEFSSALHSDIILIGDSLVAGGNPYLKEDRLGAQLSRALNKQVWSISAGSWGLRNELTYLRIHPEIVEKVDSIIFITNSEDFDEASSWACEYTHPRTYPILGILYLYKKYISRFGCDGAITPNNLLVEKGDWKKDLKDQFSTDEYKKIKIIFYLFPTKSEFENKNLENLENNGRDILRQTIRPVTIYTLGRDYRWNKKLYKDSIHPTVEGIRILTGIIKDPDSKTNIQNLR